MSTTHRFPGRRATRAVVLTCLGLASASCTTPVMHVELPGSYLTLEESAHQYKATTAEDSIFWVERFTLPKKGGNLGFWVGALKNDFETNRGYTLVEESRIEAKSELNGVQLVYEATAHGRTYRYLVALFVSDPKRNPKLIAAELGHTTARMVTDNYDSWMDPSRWPDAEELDRLRAVYGWERPETGGRMRDQDDLREATLR